MATHSTNTHTYSHSLVYSESASSQWPHRRMYFASRTQRDRKDIHFASCRRRSSRTQFIERLTGFDAISVRVKNFEIERKKIPF